VSEAERFSPKAMLRALTVGGVRFIVIGGLAAQAHGSSSLTGDLDLCYERSPENLERLAAVLRGLAAVRRGDPAFAAFPLDARALRAGDVFTLATSGGILDLLGNPDPGMTYDTLLSNAIEIPVDGETVRVAGLDDLMAMKRAAGRPKDRIELEILGALREEIDRRG
jgi:predicted nucleotidyltransferase